jgi:hypothetical protein
MAAHLKAGSHCLIRIKSEGERIALPVKKFLESKKQDSTVQWITKKNKKTGPITIRLVKFRNPRTKTIMVFATTLSKEDFSCKEISKLYQKRWQIETAFRDLTHTLKMGQWHSKKVNGILQEIYALLWLANNVKMQMNSNEMDCDFLDQDEYSKSNFKLCTKIVVDNFILIVSRQYKKLKELLLFWINRTCERRRHRSRSYPRVVKFKQSKFPMHSKVPRKAAS